MQTIDYKAAREHVMANYPNDPLLRHVALTLLEQLPKMDAEPVVHGHWIKTENGVRENINTGEMIQAYMHDCSVCGWHTGNQGRNFNYCPNCGARMDGGDV